jgi:hypothetical protein
MARRPPIGKCVHCLLENQQRTWDHVFPESWYPETTPLNLDKWKIPACDPCNKEYGRLEQDLMLRIGLCVDPNTFETAGIVPKVLRSMNPQFAKDEIDRLARESQRKKMLGQLIEGADIPTASIYPRFGEKWGRPQEQQVAVPIPKKSVDRLFEKIVRGLVYIEDGRYIEPPYAVSLHPTYQTDMPEVAGILDKFGTTHARGPGIVVRRAVVPEDGLTAIYEITIWGMFHTYASVLKGEPT